MEWKEYRTSKINTFMVAFAAIVIGLVTLVQVLFFGVRLTMRDMEGGVGAIAVLWCIGEFGMYWQDREEAIRQAFDTLESKLDEVLTRMDES